MAHAKRRMDKATTKKFLDANPDVKEALDRDARRLPKIPDDPALRMAFDEGRRYQASYMLSVAREMTVRPKKSKVKRKR